jgi:hypothetical protein
MGIHTYWKIPTQQSLNKACHLSSTCRPLFGGGDTIQLFVKSVTNILFRSFKTWTENLKGRGNHERHAHTFLRLNLNSVKQLIFVMVKCGVLFEVRTEFLNNI